MRRCQDHKRVSGRWTPQYMPQPPVKSSEIILVFLDPHNRLRFVCLFVCLCVCLWETKHWTQWIRRSLIPWRLCCGCVWYFPMCAPLVQRRINSVCYQLVWKISKMLRPQHTILKSKMAIVSVILLLLLLLSFLLAWLSNTDDVIVVYYVCIVYAPWLWTPNKGSPTEISFIHM